MKFAHMSLSSSPLRMLTAAAVAVVGLGIRPEKSKSILQAVQEANSPCGLDVFDTLSDESTLNDAKSIFLGRCLEAHPVDQCNSAVSELWQGRDLNARVGSAMTSDFCRTLGAVVAAADRSSLVDQSEIHKLLENSVSGKLRKRLAGEADGVDELD